MDAERFGNSSETGNASSGDAFDHLYPALIRVFAVIFLGYITGRVGVVSATEAKGISKFAINAAMPALLFRKISTIDFAQVNWMFLFVVTLSKCIIFAGVTIITLLFTREIGTAGAYAFFCTMSNDLALGIPIFKALYEDTHKDFVYCIYFCVLINVTVFLATGVLLMEYSQQRSRQATGSLVGIILKTLKSVLMKPVVLASLCGIAANKIFDTHLPHGVDEPLETLGNAFGASALFFLGLSVVGKIRAKFGMVILIPLSLCMAKVVILPLIIRELCTSFNIGGDELQEDWSIFGFLYGTIPPAAPTVIYAAAFGIQEDLLAFGLVISTMFFAPVMFSSSKMSTVKNMNSTNIEYRNLLANTRNDTSFVAIILACWVIMILLLSRRYKTPPHNYTVCLALSQLLLCISFVLTKSDSLIKCCNGLEAFLIICFLFATHCWTVLLAFNLASLRCSVNKSRCANRFAMYIIGWGLPACLSGILVIILKSDLGDYSVSEMDFYNFLLEKKVFLGFWIALLFISIPICIGSLVRVYRCDRHCKCDMRDKHEITSGEGTPLLSKLSRRKFHSCENAGNCASALENPTATESNMTKCSADMKDIDEVHSLLDSKEEKRKYSKPVRQNSKLEVDTDCEGLQSERHVIVILFEVFLMIVCVLYCIWILVGDETKSGIFLEVQLLVSIILSAQVLIVFVCFGFERTLIIDPLVQKARRYWYGVDEVILPEITDLPPDEYHICEQFVQYHKQSCVQALSSRAVKDSSLDNESLVNGCFLSFFGSELVEWLLEVGLAVDRITAVHYGNSLLKGRVIRHSQNRYYFKDSNLTYEFCPGWDGKLSSETF